MGPRRPFILLVILVAALTLLVGPAPRLAQAAASVFPGGSITTGPGSWDGGSGAVYPVTFDLTAGDVTVYALGVDMHASRAPAPSCPYSQPPGWPAATTSNVFQVGVTNQASLGAWINPRTSAWQNLMLDPGYYLGQQWYADAANQFQGPSLGWNTPYQGPSPNGGFTCTGDLADDTLDLKTVFHDLGPGNGFRVTAYQRVHKTTDPWSNIAYQWYPMYDAPGYQDVPEAALTKTSVKPFVYVGNMSAAAGGGTVSWANVAAVQGAPATVWVDPTWAGSHDGDIVAGHVFGYDAFTAIQEGINAVAAAGTVNIAAGNYSTPLNIDSRAGLTLSGAGAGSTILKPTSTLPWNVASYGASRQTAIRVNSSTNVTIEGLTLDLDLVKANFVFGLLYWDSTGAISGNVIKNASVPDLSGGYYEFGAYVRAPDYTDAARAQVSVTGNTFIDTGRVGVLTHDYVQATIDGNTFTKTTADFGYAIELGSVSTGSITNNDISGYYTPAASDGSDSAGVYVENAFTAGYPHINKAVTVSGNDIHGNEYGLWIGNDYDGLAGDVDIQVTLSNNNIHDNTTGGAYIVDEDRSAGSSNSLSGGGNTVVNNGARGYYFHTNGDGEIHASLSGDTISGQADGILVDNGGAAAGSLYDLSFHGSTITGSAHGVNNTTTAGVAAENNWWGSPNGPAHSSNRFNVGAQGSPVTDNVAFVPWLNAAPPAGVSFAPVTDTSPAGQFASIQAGINASNPGGTVNAAAGTFTENVTVGKPVTVAGAGQASTTVQPAVSNPNPCPSSSLCGSATAASNVFLTQASDITIRDLTVNGDNPMLTSGVIVGGADLDARNGIVENYLAGVFNNLDVHDVTVKNIYLRGMYAASGGSGFNFSNNTVNNVQAGYYSIAMFNFGGSGIMSGNTVDGASDAISSNWSRGTQYLNNTITNSGSGVHSDNNGGSGGVADLIQGNTVSNCQPDGYGVWTFAPYRDITVSGNRVTNCAVGLAAAGQGGPATTHFVDNEVNGAGLAGSTGVYVTTDEFGWGYANVSASFSGNVVTGNTDGVLLESQHLCGPASTDACTLTINATGNAIYGNGTGVNESSSPSWSPPSAPGNFVADMTGNWWGDASGPHHVAHNPAGAGNSINDSLVSGSVPFSPWLAIGTDASPAVGFQQASPMTWGVSPGVCLAAGCIPAAISMAAAGDTIVVHDGTYPGGNNVNKSLTIEAGSAPVIDCAGSGDGFDLNADSVVIQGFEIRNCADGMLGQTSNSRLSNNTVHDNLNYGGNAGVGILLWGENNNNQILDNTIYNNDRQGIFVGNCDFAGPGYSCSSATPLSTGNTISGNVIHNNGRNTLANGPDASAYGIQLWNADGNTISGNEIYGHSWLASPGLYWGQGVYICGAYGNTVSGNNLHDNDYGAVVWSCGRTAASPAANVLSGNVANANGEAGLYLLDTAVGTTATGNMVVNNGSGVLIAGSGNMVGGTSGGAANVVAYNGGPGVSVRSGAANSILSNSIFSNLGGIVLAAGANDDQPAPAIANATSGASTTTVQGTLTAAASTTYRVEIFANAACDASGFGEGQTLVGAISVTTGAGGSVTFTQLLGLAVPAGQVITATATDPLGNTSAFSGCRPVAPPTCPEDSDCDGYTDAQEFALGKDPFTYCAIMRADVNMDGVVNLLDLGEVAAYYGQPVPGAPQRYDQGPPPFDNKINLLDVGKVAGVYGRHVSECS